MVITEDAHIAASRYKQSSKCPPIHTTKQIFPVLRSQAIFLVQFSDSDGKRTLYDLQLFLSLSSKQ